MIFYKNVKKEIREDFRDIAKYGHKSLFESSSDIIQQISNGPWEIILARI